MNSKKGYKYRIKLSLNMLQQGYKEYDEIVFDTYNQAYNAVVGKWGSEVLGTPMGLTIQMAKTGTDNWVDCR